MRIVCRCTAGVVMLLVTSTAGAQLPSGPYGLPTPWQTGASYFIGPFFGPSINTSQLSGAVFCLDPQNSLQFGTLSLAFGGITSSAATFLGAACLAPGQIDPYAGGFAQFVANSFVGPPGLGSLPIPEPTGSLFPPNVAVWNTIPGLFNPPPPSPPNPPNPPAPPVPPTPTLNPHVTPEPSTWLLFGTGLVGVFGFIVIRSMRA